MTGHVRVGDFGGFRGVLSLHPPDTVGCRHARHLVPDGLSCAAPFLRNAALRMIFFDFFVGCLPGPPADPLADMDRQPAASCSVRPNSRPPPICLGRRHGRTFRIDVARMPSRAGNPGKTAARARLAKGKARRTGRHARKRARASGQAAGPENAGARKSCQKTRPRLGTSGRARKRRR